MKILVPVWHLHLLDHLAQLLSNDIFFCVGKQRLGKFGYPAADNINRIKDDLLSVDQSEFDVFLDIAEGPIWNENYFRKARKIDLPRVFCVSYSHTPHHREYYESFPDFPMIFEDRVTKEDWEYHPSYLIHSCPVLFYEKKWTGELPKGLGVMMNWRESRKFQSDARLYRFFHSVISEHFHVHDGSKDFISEEELAAKYAKYRIYVDGSIERRTTNAFLQALAMGMPCLVMENKVNENNHIIQDSENGFIVENQSEAIKKFKKLLTDRELCKKMYEKQLERRDEFIEPSMLRDKWHGLFKEAKEIYHE